MVEQQGFDPADQMQRYVRWWRQGHLSSTGGCFDIGGTVRSALSRFEATGEPFSGSTDSHSAGNGSIMRLAPVPLFFAKDPKQAISMSGMSSRTTHGAQTAVDACRYLGALIVGALQAVCKKELLSDHYTPVPGYWTGHPLCAEIDAIAAGSFKEKEPPGIKGSGYVVESLEAALWAFHNSRTFEEGCLLAVNLGDDADTTAAICGQLSGAFYGVNAIPEQWRERLTLRDDIMHLALQLYELREPQPVI